MSNLTISSNSSPSEESGFVKIFVKYVISQGKSPVKAYKLAQRDMRIQEHMDKLRFYGACNQAIQHINEMQESGEMDSYIADLMRSEFRNAANAYK